MESGYVWQTVLAILASFGGASVIIFACGKWLANITAQQILKKTEYKFSQQLEMLKSSLEKKNYISKVRFDLEIDVYRQLSETTLNMVIDAIALYPPGLSYQPLAEDKRKIQEQENLKRAIDSYNKASISISRNSAFITEENYNLFDEIRKDCGQQIHFCQTSNINNINLITKEGVHDLHMQCYKRSEEINDKIKKLMITLRKHIASIDVID